MDLRRALVPALSAGRSAIVQLSDGVPGITGPGRRLFPRQYGRLAPRAADGIEPRLADLSRPIRFPQIGRGVLHLAEVPPVADDEFARLVRSCRRRARVVVDPELVEASLDALAVLAAAGAPLEVPGLDAGSPACSDLVARLGAPPGDGRLARELHSVRLRRAAHDRLWGEVCEDVAVLLASRRPDDIDAAVAQIGRQRGCRVTVIVGVHGGGWPGDLSALEARLPAGSVVERFGDEQNLGDVLNALTERAGSDLVTKWDDDDWYGPDHLADLVRAYRYSGADIVGKGAEFVRVESADVTLRRFSVGAEAYSWTLAGGTLLTSREWLAGIGGWPSVRSGVDRAVLDASRRAGGTGYRTHGFQYVLRRRGAGTHTWGADDEHFLASATERRPGLDLALADIEG